MIAFGVLLILASVRMGKRLRLKSWGRNRIWNRGRCFRGQKTVTHFRLPSIKVSSDRIFEKVEFWNSEWIPPTLYGRVTPTGLSRVTPQGRSNAQNTLERSPAPRGNAHHTYARSSTDSHTCNYGHVVFAIFRELSFLGTPSEIGGIGMCYIKDMETQLQRKA